MDYATCPVYERPLTEDAVINQNSCTENKETQKKKTDELSLALVAPLFLGMASMAVSMGVLFRVISYAMGLNI